MTILMELPPKYTKFMQRKQPGMSQGVMIKKFLKNAGTQRFRVRA
jgi:hypothetical protein